MAKRSSKASTTISPDSILKNKSGFSELRKKSRMIKLPNSSSILVGGWTNPSEKYARQNGLIFPKVRDENKQCLSCHQHPPTMYCLVASFPARSKGFFNFAKSLRTGSHPRVRCVMIIHRMHSGCPKIKQNPVILRILGCFNIITPHFCRKIQKIPQKLQIWRHFGYLCLNSGGKYRCIYVFGGGGLPVEGAWPGHPMGHDFKKAQVQILTIYHVKSRSIWRASIFAINSACLKHWQTSRL